MLSVAQRSRSISTASSKPFNGTAEMLRCAALSMTDVNQQLHYHEK
jgi:hypothetical protein